jgi:ribosomal protein S18 acetylase RimI-like enzyme
MSSDQLTGRSADDLSSITIRQFDLERDYHAVTALWENSGTGIRLRRSDRFEEIEKKVQRDPDLFLVAESTDRIVGTVIGGFDGRRGMMYHLAVAGGHRNRGIGSMLVDKLEEELLAKGCLRYYLLVTKDNQEAIRFYEGRGWKRMDDLYAYGKNLV